MPNYNGELLLKKNFPVVLEVVGEYIKKSQTQAEIIVVDDSSTDNSLEILHDFISVARKKNTSLHVLKNEKNSGFSTTVNNGVKKATGDFVLLLNTDVQPKIGFLEPLLKNFEDQQVFGVGCLDKSVEKDTVVERGRGLGRWHRGFLLHSAGKLDKKESLWASGGSSAFRKIYWDQLEGMNELYNPFYWEDIDLSYRAWKAGYTVLFEKESVVTHYHEEGSIKIRYSNYEIQVISYRNQFLFVWNNITDSNLLFSHILWAPYHLAGALMQRNMPFLVGFCQAFLKLKNSIKWNLRFRKLRKRSDWEIIQKFRT